MSCCSKYHFVLHVCAMRFRAETMAQEGRSLQVPDGRSARSYHSPPRETVASCISPPPSLREIVLATFGTQLARSLSPGYVHARSPSSVRCMTR